MESLIVQDWPDEVAVDVLDEEIKVVLAEVVVLMEVVVIIEAELLYSAPIDAGPELDVLAGNKLQPCHIGGDVGPDLVQFRQINL